MKDDGGSAFPKQPMISIPGVGEIVNEQGGMTLRDYFAAKAMEGYCSLPWESVREWVTYGEWPDRVASHAYLIADAMLEARK